MPAQCSKMKGKGGYLAKVTAQTVGDNVSYRTIILTLKDDDMNAHSPPICPHCNNPVNVELTPASVGAGHAPILSQRISTVSAGATVAPSVAYEETRTPKSELTPNHFITSALVGCGMASLPAILAPVACSLVDACIAPSATLAMVTGGFLIGFNVTLQFINAGRYETRIKPVQLSTPKPTPTPKAEQTVHTYEVTLKRESGSVHRLWFKPPAGVTHEQVVSVARAISSPNGRWSRPYLVTQKRAISDTGYRKLKPILVQAGFIRAEKQHTEITASGRAMFRSISQNAMVSNRVA